LSAAREQYKAANGLPEAASKRASAVLEGRTVKHWTADLTVMQNQMSYQQIKGRSSETRR